MSPIIIITISVLINLVLIHLFCSGNKMTHEDTKGLAARIAETSKQIFVKESDIVSLFARLGYDVSFYKYSGAEPSIFRNGRHEAHAKQEDFNLLLNHLGIRISKVEAKPEARIIEKVATITKKK